MKRQKTATRKKPLRKQKGVKKAPSINLQQTLTAAIEHHQHGRMTEAEAGYQKILRSNPNHADANHLLGVIAYQRGNLEAAEQLISKALKTGSAQPQMHSNLGNVLQDLGRLEEAIDSYEKALAINPDFPEGHNNLGNAQKACGRNEQAIASFKKAISLRPDYVEANNNLGNALQDLQHNEEAITSLRKAITLNPAYAEAHYNLARALFDTAEQDEAAESCQQAIALKPDFVEAWVNLSVIYQKMGRKQDSLGAARQAVTIAPENSSAHTALANVLQELGLLEDALASYAQALELDPDNEEAHSNKLMTMHYAPLSTTQDLYDAASEWAEPYNDGVPEPHFANVADPDRRLRIGYVSADLNKHPVGFYLSRILPFHNDNAVEVVCYSNSRKSDDVSETLRAGSTIWRDVTGLSDNAMVEQIRQDGIDILVDLSGHTVGNRLPVFAERPAPVQVTWMGYTGTTGLTSIDYIFADRFVVPQDDKELYAETVKYLPGSYLCFDPPRFDLATVLPPARETGSITFGSFNNRVKITAETIAAWAQILNDVANSRLLLKTPLLDDESVHRSLLDKFKAHGIDEERLIFEGRSPRIDMLQAYQRVDIALDTLPFGGGVTTAEAIWMGIPVITLSSPRWAGRLGETILNSIGIPELVVTDARQYHQLAVSLAGDLPRLEQLHADLRIRMEASSFCDGPAFANKLEQAFGEIWTDWCIKQVPMEIAVQTPVQTVASSDIKRDYAIAVDHHQNGRVGEAAALYKSILQADGDHIASLHNLGVILIGEGLPDQALELFKKAIALKPDYARAYDSMGMALYQLGQVDEAVDSFRRSIAINPADEQVLYNLGNALKDKELLDEALASYGEALRLNPGNIDAQNNLCAALLDLNRPQEAAASLRNVLAMAPGFAEGHFNMANACKDMGQFNEALDYYQQALTIKPDYSEAHSSLIFIQDFIPTIDQEAQQAERKIWNDRFITPQAVHIAPHTNNRDPERRLRIGYVSADFQHHSAYVGFGPLILDYDRKNFDVICYDATIKQDQVSETLRSAATDWRQIRNMDDETLARTIRGDAIDILVDLSGHTRGNRLKAFGHKPAPLQVAGIGHLAPGISTIDYRLTTNLITPPEEESIYPEKPIYLDTYFGFMPPTELTEVGSSPCVNNGFVTFGFLGRFSKVSDDVLAQWAKILQAVTDSRLLLKFAQLDDPANQKKIKDLFSGFGITEDRLILLGKTGRNDHLAVHNRVDIVLDTFPHGGGITTLDSLWMGVPVLGLLDQNKAGGRIIKSIYRPLQLEGWVARTIDEYHDIAVGWAGKADELSVIRQGLRALISKVYARFPHDVEKAFRQIWQRWCQGEKPSTVSFHPENGPPLQGDIKQDYAAALEHHQNGRTGEAAKFYRKILESDANHLSSLHNLGVIVMGDGDPEQAAALFRKALAVKPDYDRAHDSLGIALYQLGQLDDAVGAFRQSIALNPNNPQSHFNLGNALKDMEIPDEAISSYHETLRLSPDNFEALNNLGAILLDQRRPEEAAQYLRNVLSIAPDFAEGHFNMGNACKDMGLFDKALASYAQAIRLKPDYDESWGNLGMTTMLLSLTPPLGSRPESLIPPGLESILPPGRHLAMYKYGLGAYRPHTADASYDKVVATMQTGLARPVELDSKPGHTVALLHFGRSGTGLMHSLIDNHPEISTIPSVYLSGYFNEGVWDGLIGGGMDELPDRFADQFEVLFDATSPKPVPGSKPEGLPLIGFQDGMNVVGENRDEVLSVDRQAFCAEARRLMAGLSHIDAGGFLRIVHAAYEHALGTKTAKHTLFFHIHNPGPYASFNFLCRLPDARLMMMVRNPVQSLESWVRQAVKENDHQVLFRRIATMLFDIDRIAFRKQDCIGVRLEDLKARPEATMQGLCKWIGIEDNPGLYEMTAQGKKWWGDPSSPDYDSKKQMSPFDDACVQRPSGSVLSERDRLVMETLFHPFSVRFGYCRDDQENFKGNLKKTRGILDGLLDCEQKIVDQTGAEPKEFQLHDDYRLFRAALSERLAVLEELGTYPHMLKPLVIDQG